MHRDSWVPWEDRAVSPVVGSVLLVGIAVTLMAVLAVFVLGFVAGGGAPNAEFLFAQDSGNVTITFGSGGDVYADELVVLVDDEPACLAGDGWENPIEPADYVTIVDDGSCNPTSALASGAVVRVVWESPSSGSQQILGEFVVN